MRTPLHTTSTVRFYNAAEFEFMTLKSDSVSTRKTAGFTHS